MAAPHAQNPIDASMRRVPNSRRLLQAQAAFSARSNQVLPRRPRPQLAQDFIDSPTALTSATTNLQCAIKHYGKDANGFVPTEFTWDEGPSYLPGTAEYYKSSAFRKKKDSGRDQAVGPHSDVLTHAIEGNDKNIGEKSAKPRKCKSLVMIFSKSNVRRASDKRKAHRRLQKYNRRMRFWRKVTGEKALFDWD